MKIFGHSGTSYLFLSGIAVPEAIQLSESIDLLPVSCDPNPDWITTHAKSETDIGVMAIFLRHVHSELRITEPEGKRHAILAWNAIWDAMLLGAIFDCHAICNFQCSDSAGSLSSGTQIHVTNYQFRGWTPSPLMLSPEQCNWVRQHFSQAREMLANAEFQNAVHCLSSYRWHSLPRAQLALLWAGIEGLFAIDGELVFRLSLYIARFLEPADEDARRSLFGRMKKLYKHRSKAVHGSLIKENSQDAVEESTALLKDLVIACVERGAIPNVEQLAP